MYGSASGYYCVDDNKDMREGRRLGVRAMAQRAMAIRKLCFTGLFCFIISRVAFGAVQQIDGVYAESNLVYHTRHLGVMTITNQTDQPFTVAAIESSCNCMGILTSPTTIAPGAALDVHYELTPDVVGIAEYTVHLLPDDPGNRSRNYVLRAFIEDKPYTQEQMVSSMIPAEQQPRDRSLYLDARTVRRMRKKDPQMMLVDVRPAREFDAYAIAESVNIPMHALKTKPFLRDRTVVLVDKGYGNAALEAECRRLRGEGFKDISIMHAGINAWRRSGGEVVGDPFALQGCSRLTPAECYIALQFNDWLIVTPPDEAEKILPGAVSLSMNGKEFEAALVRAVRAHPGTSYIVVVPDADQEFDVHKRLRNVDLPVFVLEGGLPACFQYGRLLAALKDGREHKEIRYIGAKPCPGCPGGI